LTLHWRATLLRHSTGEIISLGVEHSRRFTGTGVDVFDRVDSARTYLRDHGADPSMLDGLEDFSEAEDARRYSAARQRPE